MSGRKTQLLRLKKKNKTKFCMNVEGGEKF